MRMLSIALNLPIGPEATSSAGLTKELSAGLLFSDSLEQAGGFKTATTATRVAQSVRHAHDETRTSSEATEIKAARSLLAAKKETAGNALDDVEVASAPGLASRSAMPSLVKEAGIAGTGDDEIAGRTSEQGFGAKAALRRAEAAPLETLPDTSSLTALTAGQKPTGRAVAATGSDEKLDAPETTKANASAGSRASIDTPVEVVSQALPGASLDAKPVVVSAVTAPVTYATEKPALVQRPAEDREGEKKVSASEKSKANGTVAPASLKGKTVSSVDSFPSPSTVTPEVTTREQGALLSREPSVQKAQPAVITGQTYDVSEVALVVPADVPAPVASIREQATAVSGVTPKIDTKRSEPVDRKQAKEKQGSAEAQTATMQAGSVAPASPIASAARPADVAVEPAAIAAPSLLPLTPSVLAGLRETTAVKPVSVAMAAPVSGKEANTSTAIRNDAEGAIPVAKEDGAPVSQDEQKIVAIPPAESAAMPVVAPTIAGTLDSRVISGIEALAGRSNKTPVIAGGSKDRKSAAPDVKMNETPVSSSSATREPALAGRDASEAPASMARTHVEERKMPGLEDAGAQVASSSNAAINQAPVAAAPMPVASGSAPSTPAPLASVATHDPLVSMGDSTNMQHKTLQATPTVLEVGVPGGTHGWLKIRAELDEGGSVRASISSSTKDGQETLHRDLPGMSAFLESEHVPVSVQVGHVQGLAGALDIAKQESAGSTVQMSADASRTAMEAGAQQQSQREQAATSPDAELYGGGREERSRQTVQDLDDSAWSHDESYQGGRSADGGNWLNVMA